MSGMSPRTVLVHDTRVTMRRPWLVGLTCLLTVGISGAVHHFRITRELARFGRARGQMPFAFIPVAPGASTLGWIVGQLAWAAFALGLIGIVTQASAGDLFARSDDITLVASLLILLVPAWTVAARSMRRIGTAQHLVGASARSPSPIVGAALAVMLPPLGSWYTQRQLNRAWREWRT